MQREGREGVDDAVVDFARTGFPRFCREIDGGCVFVQSTSLRIVSVDWGRARCAHVLTRRPSGRNVSSAHFL